jgi:hypothetical protein
MATSIQYAIAMAFCFVGAWGFWQPPLSWWWMSIALGLLGVVFLLGAISQVGQGQ